ncbi:hypothetical protein S40285_06290 [Stachybotrys chlorohalonatus IBT 40285]|uniref:Cupin 2 conserved barrel domain-containing protein n=1 Tax=Stachybotrys chlorohalonatus (strain IBT 40285) TaxID=1283841 RepID=A0A084QTE2_STAC4|nr:hypothetical protein S40285_06290 [Stachybotrys chlorohalonata IBT 40285]
MTAESIESLHPVQGLPRVVRHITGHNSEGKSVFLVTDSGDHYGGIVNKLAVVNNLYSTHQHPVDLNAGADIKYARKNEPGVSVKNGTVCRMIDFAPNGVLPMHRVQSLDYAVVIEGVFKVMLDSGEEKIIQRGDVTIQRSTSHEWVNITGDGLLPGRVLFVLLDTRDSQVAGNKFNETLGLFDRDYAGLNGHETAIQVPIVRPNDYYESEF